MGVEKLCKMLYSRKAKMLDQCLNNSTQHPPFSEAIQNFAVMLEKAVNTVMPEFGTAKCSTSLFYDQANVQDNFKEILSGPCENVIFVSMYPFYNQHLTTPLFQAVNTFLQSNTTKVITKFTTDDSKDKDGFYIAKGNKPISFNCSTLDELAQSQGFVEFWAEKIKNELESNVDGIIFAVPLPLSGRSAYTKSVEDAAQRIMYTIYKSYPEAVPWRIAYFQSWNQFCPLLTKATLNNQHRDLRKKRGGNGQVLVVPIANLLHDFDTQTVLPSLIQRLENTKLLTAASLTNPTEEDKHEKNELQLYSNPIPGWLAFHQHYHLITILTS
uniref:Uncharacterized protein n=1 Tax=Ditylenchus dipsaci TaxID=166011 RepID=A0A915EF39_9BILA